MLLNNKSGSETFSWILDFQLWISKYFIVYVLLYFYVLHHTRNISDMVYHKYIWIISKYYFNVWWQKWVDIRYYYYVCTYLHVETSATSMYSLRLHLRLVNGRLQNRMHTPSINTFYSVFASPIIINTEIRCSSDLSLSLFYLCSF